MDIKELYNFYQSHPVVTTDSRQCPPDSIFIALKGESFDGNRFAEAALQQGCSLAVVDDEQVYNEYVSRTASGECRMALVADTLQTFKDLAREHRRRFNIPVIGITGTNGKTTTKELIRSVLAERYRVMATEGNYNNDVGVPKTLLRLTAEHEIAVVEMGASHPGDIKTLVETAEPTCGIITNVGRAHLLGFGSFEGVIRTKGELYDFLAMREGSLIFVNADNEHLAGILPAGVATERYSSHGAEGCRVTGEVIDTSGELRLRWRTSSSDTWHEVGTHLIGAYNLDNALAAVTIGLHFGVTAEQICHALENYRPSNNRSQLIDTGRNRLIVDAYNANPTSMEAALANFAQMPAEHKMVILGQMGELAEVSREEHEHLVARLQEIGVEQAWLVGDEFAPIACPYRKFGDVEEVKAALSSAMPEGFTILIKGSNSNRLFTLVDTFKAQ